MKPQPNDPAVGLGPNTMPMAAQPMANTCCRILVMNETPLIRLALGRLIEQESGLILAGLASSERETLQALDSGSADLVILGLSDRDGVGMDLIKNLRIRHPTVRILVVSSQPEHIFGRRALQAGADGFVSKTQDLETIRSAIRRVAAGGIYLSPELSARFALQYLGSGASAEASFVEGLSNRELQVFRLIGSGNKTRAISEALGISIKTVETHIDHLKRKLGVGTGVALIQRAVQWMERGMPE